jgi:hypothetical protein
MKSGYYLVGFDRRTECAAEFHYVPDAVLPTAMQTAGLTPEIAAYRGDWPLTNAAAHEIAILTGAVVDTDKMEYSLEPYAPLPTAESQPKAAE